MRFGVDGWHKLDAPAAPMRALRCKSFEIVPIRHGARIANQLLYQLSYAGKMRPRFNAQGRLEQVADARNVGAW